MIVDESSPSLKKKNQPVIDVFIWIIWILLLAGIAFGAYTTNQRSLEQTKVWVTIKKLPAYHLITNNDIVSKTVYLSKLPDDTFPQEEPPNGYYTNKPLEIAEVIKKSSIIPITDLKLCKDTIPVSIPATAAMTFNNRLSSGSVVEVWAISPTDNQKIINSTLVLRRALILNVQKTEGNVDHPYVVILAVPNDRQAEVLGMVASNLISFTLAQ